MSELSGPFSLSKFLPAGTVQIPGRSPTAWSPSHAVDDGWHPLSDDKHEDADLKFLIGHQFIYATCSAIEGTMLVVRIYVVPFDLEGYGGKLRMRDEVKVMVPARKALKLLLRNVVQDVKIWEGDLSGPAEDSRPFLPSDIVRVLSSLLRSFPHTSIHPGQPHDGRALHRAPLPLMSTLPSCSAHA
jgi:hypothetical protein